MTVRLNDRTTKRPTATTTTNDIQTNEKTVLKSCHSLKISSSLYPHPHHTHPYIPRKLHGAPALTSPHPPPSSSPLTKRLQTISQASHPRQPSTHLHTHKVFAGCLAACDTALLTSTFTTTKLTTKRATSKVIRALLHPSIQPASQAASTAVCSLHCSSQPNSQPARQAGRGVAVLAGWLYAACSYVLGGDKLFNIAYYANVVFTHYEAVSRDTVAAAPPCCRLSFSKPILYCCYDDRRSLATQFVRKVDTRSCCPCVWALLRWLLLLSLPVPFAAAVATDAYKKPGGCWVVCLLPVCGCFAHLKSLVSHSSVQLLSERSHR
ncbi:uncharacterized protein [Musca autumnalis]|uniref:uncharacterized protein n=1 Tax=Musca autumnalis TaxID=221902 RepID=UPI003CEA57FC